MTLKYHQIIRDLDTVTCAKRETTSVETTSVQQVP